MIAKRRGCSPEALAKDGVVQEHMARHTRPGGAVSSEHERHPCCRVGRDPSRRGGRITFHEPFLETAPQTVETTSLYTKPVPVSLQSCSQWPRGVQICYSCA